jgi:hypothetical protein
VPLGRHGFSELVPTSNPFSPIGPRPPVFGFRSLKGHVVTGLLAGVSGRVGVTGRAHNADASRAYHPAGMASAATPTTDTALTSGPAAVATATATTTTTTTSTVAAADHGPTSSPTAASTSAAAVASTVTAYAAAAVAVCPAAAAAGAAATTATITAPTPAAATTAVGPAAAATTAPTTLATTAVGHKVGGSGGDRVGGNRGRDGGGDYGEDGGHDPGNWGPGRSASCLNPSIAGPFWPDLCRMYPPLQECERLRGGGDAPWSGGTRLTNVNFCCAVNSCARAILAVPAVRSFVRKAQGDNAVISTLRRIGEGGPATEAFRANSLMGALSKLRPRHDTSTNVDAGEVLQKLVEETPVLSKLFVPTGASTNCWDKCRLGRLGSQGPLDFILSPNSGETRTFQQLLDSFYALEQCDVRCGIGRCTGTTAKRGFTLTGVAPGYGPRSAYVSLKRNQFKSSTCTSPISSLGIIRLKFVCDDFSESEVEIVVVSRVMYIRHGPTSGHYTVEVWSGEGWRLYDDDKPVTPCTPEMRVRHDRLAVLAFLVCVQEAPVELVHQARLCDPAPGAPSRSRSPSLSPPPPPSTPGGRQCRSAASTLP